MFQPSTSGAPRLTGGEDSGSDGGERVVEGAYDDDPGVGEFTNFTSIDDGQSSTPISEATVVGEEPATALKLGAEDQKFTCVEVSPDWSRVVTTTSDGVFSEWEIKKEFVQLGSRRVRQDQRTLKRIAFDHFDEKAVLLCFDSGEILRTNLRELRSTDVPGSSQDQGTLNVELVYQCEGEMDSRFAYFTFSRDRRILVYYNLDGVFVAIQFEEHIGPITIMLSKDYVVMQNPSIYISQKNILITSAMKSSHAHEPNDGKIETLVWSKLDSDYSKRGDGKPYKYLTRLKGKGYLSNDGEYMVISTLDSRSPSTHCKVEVYLAEDIDSYLSKKHSPVKARNVYKHVFFHKGWSHHTLKPIAARILNFESNHPYVECLKWDMFNFFHPNHDKTKPLIAIHQTDSVTSRLLLWDLNSDAFIYEIDLTMKKEVQRFSEVIYSFSADCKWLVVCSFDTRMLGLVCTRSGVYMWTSYVPQISRGDVESCGLRFDPYGTRLMISLGTTIFVLEPPCLSKKPQTQHPMLRHLYLSQTTKIYEDFEILDTIKTWPKQIVFNVLFSWKGMEQEVKSCLLDVAISQVSKRLALVCQKREDPCFLFIVDYGKTPSMDLFLFLVLQRWNQCFFRKNVSSLVKEIRVRKGQKSMSVFYYKHEQDKKEQIALFLTKGGIYVQDFDSELKQLSYWERVSDKSCFSLTQSKDQRRVISLADRHVLIINLNTKKIIKTVDYSFGLSQWWENFLDGVKFFGYSHYYDFLNQKCDNEHMLFLQERLRGLFDVSDDGNRILIGWDNKQQRSLILTPEKSEEQFRIEWDEARESLYQCSMMTQNGKWLGFIDYEQLRAESIVVCVVDTENDRRQRIWLGSDNSHAKPSSHHPLSIANFFLQVDEINEKVIALALEEIGTNINLKQFSAELVHDDDDCVQDRRSLFETMTQLTYQDKYGEKNQPSAFNMRFDGISNFHRVLVEKGEEMVKRIARIAIDSNIKVSDLYLFRNNEEYDPRSLLDHALEKNDSSLVELCLRFIENGLFPFHSASTMVKDSFFKLLFSYTELFIPILRENSLLVQVLEVEMPARYFHSSNDTSTFVYTSDTIFNWNEHFVKTGVKYFFESENKKHFSWSKNDGEGIQVPSCISFHCITNACKVGMNGITRQLLMKEVPVSIFKTMLVRNTITWKWEKLWKRHCLHELCLYIVFLVLFTSYAIGISLLSDRLKYEIRVQIVFSFLLLGVFSLTIKFTYSEYMQLRTYIEDGKKVFHTSRWGFKHYFLDSQWNFVELSSYFFILVLIPLFHVLYVFDKCSKTSLFVMVAIESILAWLKIWYYAQPFERTGALVLLISNVIYDCIPFLMLALVILVGFGVALYVLFQCCLVLTLANEQQEDEELKTTFQESYGSPLRSFSTLFYAMVGTFEPEVYYNHQSLAWLTTFVFILYMALEMIVMLNMLIAIMGDTFDKVKSEEEVQLTIGRARFIDAYEASLSARQIRAIEKKIGKFLFVLTPKDSEYATKRTDWKGKINTIEANVRKDIRKNKEELEAKIQEILENQKKNISTNPSQNEGSLS